MSGELTSLMPFMCCICMHLWPGITDEEREEDDYETLTVINGQMVCATHSGCVQGGDFTRGLGIAKEARKARGHG